MNNWWQNLRDSRIDLSQHESHWGEQLLQVLAIEGGSTAYKTHVGGSRIAALDEVFRCLTSLGARAATHCVNPDGSIWKSTFVHDAGIVTVYSPAHDDGYTEITSVLLDRKLSESIRRLGNTVLTAKKSKGSIYVLAATHTGLTLSSVGKASVAILPQNYNAEVLQDVEHVIADLRSEQPCGRIAIFSGAPGTGKTYLVRGILSAVEDAMFVLVPASLIPNLGGPQMIQTLINNRRDTRGPTVIVIEDADECLVRRAADNMSALSALLNLSDGILGATLDLRIIATTNASHTDMDEAVERPGRLCRHVFVGPLEYERASATFQRISGRDAGLPEKREYSLAELYQMARPDAAVRPRRASRPVGFRS